MWDKLYELFVMIMTFLYGLFGKEYNPTDSNSQSTQSQQSAEKEEDKND